MIAKVLKKLTPRKELLTNFGKKKMTKSNFIFLSTFVAVDKAFKSSL
jgi:hypothetical protein